MSDRINRERKRSESSLLLSTQIYKVQYVNQDVGDRYSEQSLTKACPEC